MQTFSFRQLLPAALLVLNSASGLAAGTHDSPGRPLPESPLPGRPLSARPLSPRSLSPRSVDAGSAPGKPVPGTLKRYTLKGDIKGRKFPAKVYISYKDAGKFIRDSVVTTDGHFVLKGMISRPLVAHVSLSKQAPEQWDPPGRNIYLDPGVMTLSSDGPLAEASLTGSPSTKLSEQWDSICRPYVEELDALQTRKWYFRANRDSLRLLDTRLDQTQARMYEAMTAFVAGHSDSWVSWDLVDQRRVAMNPDLLEPAYKALSQQFRTSAQGKALAEQIANVRGVEVGVRSADFSQNDENGRPITLRSLRGKYVLIDFWASWCGICRLENPNVLRAYNAYKDSGFTVLGVSLDDSKAKWIQAVKEDNMPWQQTCDMKGKYNDVATQYGIVGIPQNVLLDPNGVIIAKNLRDLALMSKLIEIFDAGRNMHVAGSIDGLKDDRMEASFMVNGQPHTETVRITDGRFSWLSSIPEPERVKITFLPSGRTTQFFADNGYLEISGNIDSLNVKGSWLNEEANYFYKGHPNATGAEKLAYVKEHPASLLSLSLLDDMAASEPGNSQLYPLFLSLSDVVREMPTGRRLASKLSAAPAQPSSTSPDQAGTAAAQSSAQPGTCTLVISYTGEKARSAYLAWFEGEQYKLDSADISTGKCTFNVALTDPASARIWLEPRGLGFSNGHAPDVLYFYMENGTIHVDAVDSIRRAVITGSRINDEVAVYRRFISGPMKEMEDIQVALLSAPPEKRQDTAFLNPYYARQKEAGLRLKELDKQFARENPDNFASIQALQEAGGMNIDASVFAPLFGHLSERIRNTAAGKKYAQQLETARKTGIGATAPDFTQNDPGGKPIRLSDFRGKYVLLDFWASWCGPCRKENPNYVEAYNKYKTKNFTLLGVSLDKAEDKAAWIAAIKKDGLKWPQVSDLKYWHNEVAHLYDIRAVPQNFLIDPNGKVIARNLRGEELQKKLKELFD